MKHFFADVNTNLSAIRKQNEGNNEKTLFINSYQSLERPSEATRRSNLAPLAQIRFNLVLGHFTWPSSSLIIRRPGRCRAFSSSMVLVPLLLSLFPRLGPVIIRLGKVVCRIGRLGCVMVDYIDAHPISSVSVANHAVNARRSRPVTGLPHLNSFQLQGILYSRMARLQGGELFEICKILRV